MSQPPCLCGTFKSEDQVDHLLAVLGEPLSLEEIIKFLEPLDDILICPTLKWPEVHTLQEVLEDVRRLQGGIIVVSRV